MAKFYYGTELLPEIPVVDDCLYYWMFIRNGKYSVILSPEKWYFANGKMMLYTNCTYYRYTLVNDVWGDVTSWEDDGQFPPYDTFFANHDIPNGSATSTDIYMYGMTPVPENGTEPEEPEEPSWIVGDVLTIDFTDAEWKTKYPDIYNVTESTGFYTASTLQYNGKDTLRSYGINHNATSQTAITFTMVNDGVLSLNYTVSSESNYDWLWIDIDGTNVVKKSGTVAWTDYSKELTAGTHSLVLKYTKDGSNADGSDAGAIGYLTISGVLPPYDTKYLIRSDSTIYTVTDGVLTALSETNLTASLFLNSGFDSIPDSSLLVTLADPEVMFWTDGDDLPVMTATVTGTPFPQTVITNDVDMSDPTVLGIESVEISASDDVLFAMSFDGGNTWKGYINQWVTLETENSGMTAAQFRNIPIEAWAQQATTGHYMVRFVLADAESYVENITVHYIN